MTERLNRDDAERILSRALELQQEGEGWHRDTLLDAAAEVAIDRSAMLSALTEVETQGSAQALDRLLGPDVLTGARFIPAAEPRAVDDAATGFLVRKRLTPATRPATWLQQRGTWPDPLAQNSIAVTSIGVRPADGGSDLTIRVMLEDLRSSYVLAFMVTLMVSVLIMVVLPGWGLLPGLGAPLMGGAMLRASYRSHIDAVRAAIDHALGDIAVGSAVAPVR